jgi:hypothetical protein
MHLVRHAQQRIYPAPVKLGPNSTSGVFIFDNQTSGQQAYTSVYLLPTLYLCIIFF